MTTLTARAEEYPIAGVFSISREKRTIARMVEKGQNEAALRYAGDDAQLRHAVWILRADCLASEISSTDCGRFASVSRLSVMKVSSLRCVAVVCRAMPICSASERRCCWSSSAALSGPSETLTQSTFS